MKVKLTAIAVTALLLGATVAEAKAPRGFYGVTPQTKLTPKDFNRMGKGRVGTLRYEVSWNDIERMPASEEAVFAEREYAWWVFDPIVYLAAKQGIRVLPTMYGTPNWVAAFQGCVTGCHTLGPNTTTAYIAFSLFMRAAVERYGPDGEFWDQHPDLPYRPIRSWQIWNEQNSSDFWKPWPNPIDYANLVIAGGEAVHEVDPGATVVLGGMIGDPAAEGKKTISGWELLRQLYNNPRARAAFDDIAIHPYGSSLYQIKRILWRWREELRVAHAATDRIWITEIGWASAGEEHPLNRGPRGQAQLLRQTFKYFTAKRRKMRIANLDYYAWRDAAPNSPQCSWCGRSGLFRYPGFRPKPAWHAYTSFTGGR